MALLSGLLSGAAAKPADGPSVEEAIAAFERSPDLATGNDLRRLCRERAQVRRCVEALDGIAGRLPNVAAVRYHAALAYVDDLPGRSLLRQGTLSTHSIGHVSAVLTAKPDDWLALYIRGLNNLYWPTWFLRTRRAITDLSRCVEISERMPEPTRPSYHALAYAALGDAQVKAGDTAHGLETWARGIERFPASVELRVRRELRAGDARAFVDRHRDLDKPIDTDLTFVWRQP